LFFLGDHGGNRVIDVSGRRHRQLFRRDRSEICSTDYEGFVA